MNRKTALAAVLTCLAFAPALGHAQGYTSELRNARVGAPDNAKTEIVAKFYRDVFGYQEVDRLSLSEGRIELVLNTGKSVAAAKANKGVKLLVISASDGTYPEPVSHLVFEVSDNAAALKSVVAHGGKIVFSRTASTTGLFSAVSMITDPVGNKVEVLTVKK